MDLTLYLKNVPTGTTLYSVVSGKVSFKEVRNNIIVVLDHNHCEQLYHCTGRLYNSGLDGECVLFPSKDLRDWELFTKFKKGDVIVTEDGIIAIFDHMENKSRPDTIVYQAIRYFDGSVKVKTSTCIGYASKARLATQEEKDLFFKALNKEGYFWNGEEVVSVFKKGDIIVSGQDTFAIIDHVGDFGSHKDVVYYQACYNTLHGMIIKTDIGVGSIKDCRHACESDKKYFLSVLEQMGYTVKDGCVIKKRFDPQTFEPFQKVLVRATSTSNWRCTFFSHMGDSKAICSGDNWSYCIPYENNEHLRGKANDCDDFYKWWKLSKD